MRRLVLYLSGVTVLAVALLALLHLPSTAALTSADWQAGNIISDAIFTDAGGMSAQQVQQFLDNQINAGGGCDTWGTQSATEWGRPDLTHAQFASLKGWPAPPYICLNGYYEVPKTTPSAGIPDNSYNHYDAGTKTLLPVPGGVSAAQIIYNAAQQYQINPEVLLVKIQTESAGPLTQDTWPLQSQYTYAMGSNCPDSGPNHTANCDPDYSGFSMQVYSAASLLRSYLDNMNQPWWTHYKVGNNTIQYNPDTSCGSSTINVQSMGTAALYTYTPYQPNGAALQVMNDTTAVSPGGSTVTCGAYGNRNFWWWFNHWFGSSIILPEVDGRYQALATAGQTMGDAIDNGYCVDAAHTSCWQGFKNGYIVYNKDAGAWESLGSIRVRWGILGYQYGEMGFPVGPVVCGTIKDNGCYQQYQNGYIVGTGATGYWESLGDIRTKWSQLNAQDGSLGYPTGSVYRLSTGGYYQQYQNGYIVGSSATGWWESLGGPIRDKWGALGFQDGRLGYPKSDPDCTQPNSGCVQHFQGGTVYWTQSTGAWQVWGLIANRYDQIDTANSSLGYPINAEVCGTIRDYGCYQQYQNGYIVGTGATGYWESYGPIRAKWSTLGFQDGRLGYATSAQDCTQPNSGCVQHFQGGTVYWTQSTGAWQVWGMIGLRYIQLNTVNSGLGYPVDAEVCGTIKDNGCYQQYQNGYIVGSSATGWWESLGGIRARWSQLGFQDGVLGYPLNAQVCGTRDNGCYQQYQGGYIIGTDSTGYWESYGPIRSKWESLGYENSVLGYPTGAISCAVGTCSQTYEHGIITSNSSGTQYTTTP